MRKLFLALIISVIMVCSGSALAVTITYSDFIDLSDFQLNGSAVISNTYPTNNKSSLRLTNALSQGGSVFLTDTVSLASDASFSTAFHFQITNPMGISDSDGKGADGIVFVVQTLANNVGGTGGGIGYSGISNSVGIEFDTWNNGSWDDYNGNHIGINLNGNINSVVQQGISSRMNNGAIWYSWVDYNGVTDLLEVRLAQANVRPSSANLSQTVDLVSVLGTPDSYVGFTSGTGAAGGYHDILAWQLNSTYDPINIVGSPVPEPATMLLLGSGLLGLFGFKRKIKA